VPGREEDVGIRPTSRCPPTRGRVVPQGDFKFAGRLAGILHGCLETRTLYDEATAWPHREKPLNLPCTFMLILAPPGRPPAAPRPVSQQQTRPWRRRRTREAEIAA
jgi:hypothetical protein